MFKWFELYSRGVPLILACVMSREFTRDAVMKFLPAQFS